MPSYDFERVSFQEAIDYFRSKTNVPSETWTEVWASENETAFTVAGAMAEDLLGDLRQAVDKAIASGTSREEFLRDFESIVGRTGWAYRGGKEWRAGVIWQTNMRSAYRAGQRRQQQDPAVLAKRQFVQWLHGGTPHPRPLHLSLHRKIYPADQADHLWRIIGGFGCQCEIVTVSQRDIDREGLTIEGEAPKVGDSVQLKDGRGREVTVRVEPDPGWDYLPGEGGSDRPLDQPTSDAPPVLDSADPDRYYRDEAAKIFETLRPKLEQDLSGPLAELKEQYAEIEAKKKAGTLEDEFNAETKRLREQATELEESEPGTARTLREQVGGRKFLNLEEIQAYLRNELADRFAETAADKYARLAKTIPDATDAATLAVVAQEQQLTQVKQEMDAQGDRWRPADPSWADEYNLDNPKDLAKVKREVLAELNQVRFDREDVTNAKLAKIQEIIKDYAMRL